MQSPMLPSVNADVMELAVCAAIHRGRRSDPGDHRGFDGLRTEALPARWRHTSHPRPSVPSPRPARPPQRRPRTYPFRVGDAAGTDLPDRADRLSSRLALNCARAGISRAQMRATRLGGHHGGRGLISGQPTISASLGHRRSPAAARKRACHYVAPTWPGRGCLRRRWAGDIVWPAGRRDGHANFATIGSPSRARPVDYVK